MSPQTRTGSPTSPLTQETHTSRKRPRTRTGVACYTCQRRKSRCELLNGEESGCHRCQLLGTACSLIPDRPRRSRDSDTPSDLDILRRIDAKTDWIEQALFEGFARGSIATRGAVEIPTDPQAEQTRRGGAGNIILRAFRQNTSSQWIDPVKMDLISESRLEQNVQQFCDHQATFLFPTDSVRHLIKENLSHPLVRNAILLHTMPHLRPRLQTMLQANLRTADAVPSSLSIFVGYLILCQAPQMREDLVTTIDVLSAARRGLAQAIAIGLDDLVHAVAVPGFDWTVETEAVQHLAALYLVLHRLGCTPGFTPNTTLPLLNRILPLTIAIQLRSKLLLHLSLESMLFELLEPVVSAFRQVRVERRFDTRSVEQLLLEFSVLQSKLLQWRADVAFHDLSSSSFLLYHSHLVEVSLAMVLSGTYIPTPIVYPKRQAIVTTFGGALLQASLTSIEHILDSDLDVSQLPSFHVILALLPLGALVQSGKLHPDSDEVVRRQNTLDKYRVVLGFAHPKLKRIIEDLDNMQPPNEYETYRGDLGDNNTISRYPGWNLEPEQLFDLHCLWPTMLWPLQDTNSP